MLIQDQKRHISAEFEDKEYYRSLSLVDTTVEFQSLEQLLRVNSEDIFVGPLVGEGAFSKVYSAKLKFRTFQIPVAVKAVKGMIDCMVTKCNYRILI